MNNCGQDWTRHRTSSKRDLGRKRPAFALILWLLTAVVPAKAQWLTQSILVKPGWTAVYLHVDASSAALDDLVGADPSNPISEIWLWAAAPTAQFVTSPQSPTTASSQWRNWGRLALGGQNSLTVLVPNAAYLVHSTASANYTWQVRGRPFAPQYTWSSAGLNFLGFPTVPNAPPPFDKFLSLAPALQSSAEIYQYQGGNLGATNPSRLFALHTTPVRRGQAFWVRSGSAFNNYFGPFNVALSKPEGISFADASSRYSFHLRNPTPTNVTVNLRLIASEPPPAGQTAIAGLPPLLVRGAFNPTNLTYGVSDLSGGAVQSWTLAPQGQSGSDVEVVLGVNRSALPNTPGALYAGILQFTDAFGWSEVDVGVSAQVTSSGGLWIGKASVTQVRNYLKTYQRDTNNSPVVSTNGTYVISGVDTNLGPVARAFPLPLIIHHDGTTARLLQRIYYGLDPYTNVIISTKESALDPAHLNLARRISATHLPWSEANTPWTLSGQLAQGGTLTTTVDLAYDDQSANPFLHTYHPDHDNLDASFKTQLPLGYESYRVTRQITLQMNPVGSDFGSLTSAGETFSGAYLETITVWGLAGAHRDFNVSGFFTLNRVSPIATLNQL